MHSFIYREFMLAGRPGSDVAGATGDASPPAAHLPDPAQDVPPLAARQTKEY